jgi:hypothetical protein
MPKTEVSKTLNRILAAGQKVAREDSLVGALRSVLPGASRRGFDIGTGLCKNPNERGTVHYQPSVPEALGYNAAISLCRGRNLHSKPANLHSCKALSGYYVALGSKGLPITDRAILLHTLSEHPVVRVGVRLAVGAATFGESSDAGAGDFVRGGSYASAFGGVSNFFGMDTSTGGAGQADVNAQISAAGLDTSKLQQAALSAGLSLSDFYKLQSAVTNPKDLAASLSAVVNQDSLAQASLHALGGGLPEGTMTGLMSAGKSILSGNLMGSIGPVVATAMTASGVGAPIVGAVGAAISLGEAALNALGIGQNSQQTCGWAVNHYCGNGTRPYGSSDPTWVALGPVIHDKKYAIGFPVPNGYWPPGGNAPTGYSIDPFYATIESELNYLEGHGPNLQTTTAAKDARLNPFRLAFYRAYLGQLERAINGQPPVDPATLLNQTALQWNASHGGTPVSIDSGQPMPDYWAGSNVDGRTGVNLYGDNGSHPGIFKQTYIERLISGKVDGSRQPPLTINTGELLSTTPAQIKTAAIHHVTMHLGGAALPTHEKVAAAARIAAAASKKKHYLWPVLAGAAGAGFAGLKLSGNPLVGVLAAVGGGLGAAAAVKYET